MINPFKHTASEVRAYYRDAADSDVMPPNATRVAVTLVMPVLIPATFIAAFFKKDPAR